GPEGHEAVLAISGLRCATCAWVIERYLGGRKGVTSARVNTATGRARIRWNPESAGIADIAGWIRELGYGPHPADSSGPEESLDREKRDLLIRFGTAAFFSMQAMTFTAGLYAGYFQGIEPKYVVAFKALAFALTTPVIFYAGYPFLRSALAGFRNRIVGMDALVFLGSFSAYAYSTVMLATGGEVYFDTAGMIITLILLGRYLEAAARSRASESLTRLIRLAPRQAKRRIGGDRGLSPRTETVSASFLKPGDVVEVAPGEKIPADGRVIDGTSEADESLLTGEAGPVPKRAESEVYAGTINGWGRLAVEVVRTGRESALSRIVRAVEEAQARKAPIQNVADRVVGVFVPAVIAVALLAAAFRLLSGDSPVPALLASVSLLVVACPCALGLATPLAVVVASGTARASGILIKGGDVLEAGASVTEVFLDKTGTLTEGSPRLADVIGFGVPVERVLRLAASLESPSEHPLARAIRKGAEGGGLPIVTEFRAHPGMGVEGIVDGGRHFLGREEFLSHHGIPVTGSQRERYLELGEARKTAVILADEERVLGILSAEDAVRREAAVSVRRLKADGYRVRLVTGDSGPVASRVAMEAGIDDVLSRVTPAEKAEMIRSARSGGDRILMVGDGINDAPALVEADVGMAMGRGTDVAIESADAVLTGGDLRLVHGFLTLSRKTMRVIRQNLAWAFSYNLVAIPLAVTGHLHPILAAGLMSASSLVVVGNSLRLKKG
ncbi:MAG TPA: cation-translocating P-type ATPase, partial [Candidatus Limnocylindrales bacterium]|nr:cation-translocating P-type ATPase [Candidatus Limnocylindrales bacterium]